MKIICQKCGNEVGEIHDAENFDDMPPEDQDKAIEKEMIKGNGQTK